MSLQDKRRGEDIQGRRQCEDRGRDWSDLPTSQGMPRQPPEAGRGGHGTDSPSEPPKGTNPTDKPSFQTSGLQNSERVNFCCLSHQVCGNLLQ